MTLFVTHGRKILGTNPEERFRELSQSSRRVLGDFWESSRRALGKLSQGSRRLLGDFWESSRRALGQLSESSGRLLGDFWESSRRALGGSRGTLGEFWENSRRALGEFWENSGRLLGELSGGSGRTLGEPSESSARAGGRRLNPRLRGRCTEIFRRLAKSVKIHASLEIEGKTRRISAKFHDIFFEARRPCHAPGFARAR